MFALLAAFVVVTHLAGPIVGPAAVQIAAEYSSHQGFKDFAAAAIARDVDIDAE